MSSPTGPDDPSSPRARFITLGLGVATVAVALIGFGLALPLESIADRIYRALQLFVLDGAALAAPGGSGSIELNPWLQVARFAAPVVTVAAVLLALPTLFLRILRRRVAIWYPGHVIVCGDTAEARALAENVQRHTRVVLVTSRPSEATGVPVVLGNPGRPATLRTAGVRLAGRVYAMTEDEMTNMAIAISAARQPSWFRLRRRTWARTRDASLLTGLRLQQAARTSAPRSGVDYFRLPEAAARAMLTTHPADHGAVLAGGGPVHDEVRRLIGLAGGPVTVAPALDRPMDEILDAVRRSPAGRVTAYICPGPGDRDAAIELALALSRDQDTRIVLCLPRRALLADLLPADGPIAVFGVLDQACTPDAILECSVVERTARRIHGNYVDEARRRGETETSNPSTVPWSRLHPQMKASNLAQAEHTGVKLAQVGAVLTNIPQSKDFTFDEAEVLQLAQLEHVRWMRERLDAGLRYGPTRTRKEHPDLVDWPDLSDAARQKDLAAVRNLPGLLAAEQLYLRRDADRPQ